jgi:hypothetical protein
MIKAAASYFAGIPSVFIDGLLYCLIALFMFCQTYFGGDEAAKYISPTTKFWINGAFGALGAVVGSLKMFRSNTFAEHQKSKEEEKP